METKTVPDWKIGEFTDGSGRKFKSLLAGKYRVKPSKYGPGKGKSISTPWCFVDHKPRPRENDYACRSCMCKLRCGV